MTTEEEAKEQNEKFDRLVRYSGMPLITAKTHLLMKFLPGKGNKKAYQTALDYVAADDEGKSKREHHFIIFVGETGRGKTHLALAIGWQWLGLGLETVKYWQVSELLDAMRAEYDNPPKNDYGFPLPGEFDKCKGVSLLILDDLGVEQSTPWAREKLDTLINHRWLEQKPTVFTTNMAPSQLQPRLRSRIKEGVVVTLEGIDYREFKAKMRREKKDVQDV